MHITTALVRTALLLFVSIMLHGCATMYAPSSDTLTIKTIPDGADVYSGVNLLGKTPLTHTFKRETFEQKTLKIQLAGYKSQELVLQRVLEKKALYNFAFFITTCGGTSWAIDALNGNMIMYSPDSYLIEMEKNDGSAQKKDHAQWNRIRFIALNQDSLMKDIARGDGEYLRAYFEAGPNTQSRDEYRAFLKKVDGHAPSLLLSNDPVDFYNRLEKL
jgi:PEGA domain